MAKISLRDYQKDAVKFSLKDDYKNTLYCMKVGCGKTVCAMFSIRAQMKRNLADKAIVACTKSSVSVFIHDFKEHAGLDVKLIETEEDLVKFVKGKEKICIIKHSMFKKAGSDLLTIKALEKYFKENDTKISLVIDEAHKMQNPEGVEHEGLHRLDFIFDRIMMYTATPYMSCLSQLYGLVHLIYPELWKNRKAFFDDFIDEIMVRDPRTKRVVRKEIVRYKNLDKLRKMLEPFTFFYYPPVPLVHVEHYTELESYDEYNDLCKGILRDEDEEKIEKAKEKRKKKDD